MPRNMTINEKQYQVMDAVEAGIVAGMVLDEAAAKHLFQVRSENVGNNLRKKVKEAADAGKSEAEIQQIVTDYDRAYTFSMPGIGGTRKVVDPLERECRKLAKDAIKDKLAEQGRKLKDVDPEKLEAKIDEWAQNEAIVKLAKTRLAQMRKAGAEALELDL